MTLNEEQDETTTTQNIELEIDRDKLERYLENRRGDQSLLKGTIFGLLAALLGAIIWAAITVATGYQIGYMALAVGFLVGISIKIFGKGIDPVFGYIGAALALLGCLLGNLFAIIGFLSIDGSTPILEIIGNLGIIILIRLMIIAFDFMDIIFYGIAIYEGYRFSINRISKEELVKLSANE